MEKIILVFPTEQYEEQAKEFILEFKKYNSNINGTGGLHRYTDNYKEWLEKINDGLTNSSSDQVPAITYFAVREQDNCIVGMINIRYYLNKVLLEHGGHIGYGVRPTERQKGYATEILRLGLNYCKELGLDKVLVTCDKSNIGSAKTIQKNLGILENEVLAENEIVQRYWIDIN